VILPWEPLREVLNLIASVDGDPAAYRLLQKAGGHVLDLLPGAVLRRAPSRPERDARMRMEDSYSAGRRCLMFPVLCLVLLHLCGRGIMLSC
jgi:hypothetical protein